MQTVIFPWEDGKPLSPCLACSCLNSSSPPAPYWYFLPSIFYEPQSFTMRLGVLLLLLTFIEYGLE